MKKRKMIKLTFALIFAIICTNVVPVKGIEKVGMQLDLLCYQKNNQDDALNAYGMLAEFLGLNKIDGAHEWPDEYAGCYINKNNVLIICLTNLEESTRQKYIDICGDKIDFQLSLYSINDFDRLTKNLETHEETVGVSIGYSSEYNRLDIHVEDKRAKEVFKLIDELKSNESYSQATNKIDNMYIEAGILDNIKIIESNNEIKCETENFESGYTPLELNATKSVKPGGGIKNSLGSFTLGIWANRQVGNQTYVGFITCAHAFYENRGRGDFVPNSVNVYSESTSELLGYTGFSLVYLGDLYYDSAFVPLTNSSYSPTTSLASGGTISQLYPGTVPEGTIMYICGKNSGLASGVSNYTVYSDSSLADKGYEIYISNGSVVDGDSGGPAFIIQNGQRKLAGFQSEVKSNTAKAVSAVFIFNKLNATIYAG